MAIAIAVLRSNDHAGNVVRVIAGDTRPSLRIYGVRAWREPPLPASPARVSVADLAKSLGKFPTTSTHETTGGSSTGFSCWQSWHSFICACRKIGLKNGILWAFATRSMHMEGLQVMRLDYILWGGLWQGAWECLKTHPLWPAVVAPCHWECRAPQVHLI